MSRRLLAYRDENHGVEGYRPCVHRHYLFAVDADDRDARLHGKQHYVTIDGTSRTWLSEDKKRAWLEASGTVWVA